MFVAVALATAVSSFAATAASHDHKAAKKPAATVMEALGFHSSSSAKDEAKTIKSVKVKKVGKSTVVATSTKGEKVLKAVKSTSNAATTKRKARKLAPRVKVTVNTRAAGAPIVASAPKMPASSTQYSAIVSRYAATYGVPVSLAHAVIGVESNYNASARGSHGEIGLMQIKPATARMMGYSGSASGLFDPETNIKYGMMYLAKAHQLGGGATCGTILRYNAGHAATRMNPVSAAYCSKVMTRMAGA